MVTVTPRHLRLADAERLGARLVAHLGPCCDRIEVVGSIRRKRPTVDGIQLLLIPKEYQVGLFLNGLALAVKDWRHVKGTLPCKHAQRVLPNMGVAVDLFMVTEINWGLHAIYRSAGEDWLVHFWQQAKLKGYEFRDGQMYAQGRTSPVILREELDVFRRLSWPFIKPEDRDMIRKARK